MSRFQDETQRARGKRRALTRPNNKLMLPLTGIRDRYALAFERAGMPLQECFDGLFGGRSCAPAESFAAITGPKPAGERWIGITPFAAHKGKIYPERQMEQVVAALAAEPDVLLLDEPFSALDYQTRLEVCDDVQGIIKSEKKTALLITHDISEAIALADKVVVLSARPAHVVAEHEIDFGDGSPKKRRECGNFAATFEVLRKELGI